MGTFADRLKRAMTYAKRERADLQRHLRISPQGMGQILNGTTKAMSADNAARAARFLGVSIYWLCTGEGPMLETTAISARTLPFRRIKPDDLARLKALGKLGEAESFMLGLLAAVDGDDTKSRAS